MSDGTGDIDRIIGKLQGLFVNMAPELKLVGEAVATEIVKTTLAGIGENDQPFAPYSPGYSELLKSVGDKPGGVVNLRGRFYHNAHQSRYRGKKDLGQGRKGKSKVKFATGREVTFNTSQETRPMLGVTDPNSEMSLDLIHVEPHDDRVTVFYEGRQKDYMIFHNRGDGKLPKRTWFTAKKAAIAAVIDATFKKVIAARVQRFMRTGSFAEAGK